MTPSRDGFFQAYDAVDAVALEPYLVPGEWKLTSQATRWLLDRWAAEDEASPAAPAPPAEQRRKYIGGVRV